MSRTNKSILLFGSGEVTPLLASRSDVERVTAGCRTLQNMFVRTSGGVERRPGTQFIAEAASPVELAHVSYEGDAVLYGITELGDVSDPPRKYLQLCPNYAAVVRDITSPFSRMGFAALNRTAYDLTGTRTHQVQAWLGTTSGAPGGLAAGEVLGGEGDSLEDVRWDLQDDPWNDTGPTWHRDKRSKWFTLADFGTPGAADNEREYYGQGFGRLGGVVTTIRGLTFGYVWSVDHWVLTLEMYTDDGAQSRSVFATMAPGDQDPGAPTTSDIFAGNSSAAFPQFTLYVPPDTSVRFMVQNESGSAGQVQIPQQIGTTITNGTEGASGLTEDSFDRWFYFAASETLQAEWRFEERLSVEDTLTDAVQRSSGVTVGTSDLATTTALSGGTTAESNDPLNWTGRVVNSTKVFSGLTVGNRYSVNVTHRTNTIGLSDFVTASEAGEEFVAAATTHAYTYEVRAPLNKERRVLTMVATSEGADPVPDDYESETLAWYGKVLANGGTLENDSLQIANDLVVSLKAASLWSKLVYFLPLLGSNLAAIAVPLRDRDRRGNATLTGFAAGNFSQASGLTSDGSGKRVLLAGYRANMLGSSNNGGCGYWELASNFASGTSDACIWAFNTAVTQGFGIVPEETGPQRVFHWAAFANGAVASGAGGNRYYHGERRGATDRELYENGASVATNTNSDATSGAGDRDIYLMANASTTSYAGRCGCALLTNGTLADADVASLYAILRDDLMTPTGRI